VASLDGHFKQLTPAWTARLGWTLEELEARQLFDLVHPDDRATTLMELGKLATGANSIAFENRYRHQNGSYRWLHWSAKRIPGVPLIDATAHDVTEQKRLEQEVVEISDREKDRLGRDLHDGLCQNLAGIAALSTTLSRKLAGNEQAAADAAEISRLLNQAVAETRDLARGLSPVELERAGLCVALETFAANVRALFHVACALRCNRPAFRLRPDVERHLYRIAQEAVRNAVSHGQARRIRLTLRFDSGRGILAIADNGVGIPEEDRSQVEFHSLDYRTRMIGASLRVRRRPRHGTRVECVFDLPAVVESSAEASVATPRQPRPARERRSRAKSSQLPPRSPRESPS
jgi:PAS domain S-box-containing protein